MILIDLCCLLTALHQRRDSDQEQAEQQARIAVLHEDEQALYTVFCEAVNALADGPMKDLLDAQRAVKDAGGYWQTGLARVAIGGITKFRRRQAEVENRARWERKAGILK